MTVTASAPATCLPMDAQTRAMFDDTLDRFVDEHYTPAARLARLKKRPTDYRTHWAALAELGILGAGLPEALGGVEGQGWKIAKFLLARERSFIADTGNKLRMMAQIRDTVARYLPHQSAQAQALAERRLAELDASLTALLALESDYIAQWMAGRDDGIGASVLKLRGSELLQQMTIFWREAMGPYSACYDPADRKEGDGLGSELPWVQAAAVNYNYLYGRCWSVFGGSSEVQRNLIAQTLLRA